MSFQVGDVVKLNSGGPAMTVSFVGEKKFPHGGTVPVVTCKWFEGNQLNSESFDPKILNKSEKLA